MKAILIANGEVSNYAKMKKYINNDDVIICADGGYDHAVAMGLIPNIVIGDMDSVKNKNIQAKEIVYPTKKDYTDSELVVEFAKNKGYKKVVLMGFTGTRMDHTLTNLFMLTALSQIDAVIVNEHNEIRFSKAENVLVGQKGDLVSIIPINGNLSQVTTENLEYPLINETLYFGKGRGVSNVMTDDMCKICIKSGIGLIIKSND